MPSASLDLAAVRMVKANSVAAYAYSDNYLIDLKHAVIMDVEATTAIRQAEVGAAKTMLDRTAEQLPSVRIPSAPPGSPSELRWFPGFPNPATC
jgi:hypothetical protein